MKQQGKLFIPLIFLLIPNLVFGEIYKYQDEHGRWHFSDKKPKHQTKVEHVEVKINNPLSKTFKVELVKEEDNGKINFLLKNPLFAPVQCYFHLPGYDAPEQALIESQSEINILASQDQWLRESDIEYGCLIGSPETKPDNSLYQVPFKGFKSLQVTQGFKGRFSHNQQPQLYAIDIGMPVGTQIVAARDGIVLDTRDNYAHSGVSSSYFYDKANYVMVLHEDGTYATYGHLLIGKIPVKPGDPVKAGDLIGYSGNTGFSTGPHLHFVIQYNQQGKPSSHKFRLQQSDGSIVEPNRGIWLLPAN